MKNFLLIFIVFFSSFINSQISETMKLTLPKIKFKANENQKFGFDENLNPEWNEFYKKIEIYSGQDFTIPFKSVGKNEIDFVDVLIPSLKKYKGKFAFKINELELDFISKNDSVLTLFLPKKSKSYKLKSFYFFQNEQYFCGQLDVKIYDSQREKIYLIDFENPSLDTKVLEREINSIYKSTNIDFEIDFLPKFKSKVFHSQTIFTGSSSNNISYTGQMQLLRDLFIESNPNYDKNAFYIFLVKGFTDSSKAYMPKNKAIGFVAKDKSERKMARLIAQNIGFGKGMLRYSWENKGPKKGTTENLMDSSGLNLNHFQWEFLRHSTNSYSFFDADENVKTNNGIVAYYFWKENENGEIILSNKDNNSIFSVIKRPYKKNFLSFRFDVKYKIFKPFYKIQKYYISIINVTFLLIILFVIFKFRKRLKKLWEAKQYKSKLFRRVIYLPIIFLAFVVFVLSLELSNFILQKIKVISGPLEEIYGENYQSAKRNLLINPNLSHQEERSICSEILIQRGKNWIIKKRMKVLYFDVFEDTINSNSVKIKYKSNSDTLRLVNLETPIKAKTHYMIFSFKRQNGSTEKQEIYNHLGINLSSKFENSDSKTDSPKRILLFVNGYRPTSVGHSFEDNFNDIKSKGLEHPNSLNHIFNFDRYDYWTQWNQINLLFQNRLSPNETFYADGHFSVSTSNFRNIIQFTQISNDYPKRCKNLKKHNCELSASKGVRTVFSKRIKTKKQLELSSNKRGFNFRKNKGRIAGLNLLQILNEYPNSSKDDTIDLVVHSMGFAYSLGIIEELRSKINFGRFYILAPENAKAGKINANEWQEVWHYGSDFEKDPACLQDGVAPQSKIRGLSHKNRVFIPKKMDPKKGFFDSHFVGYYTWILDLKENQKGHIKQRSN